MSCLVNKVGKRFRKKRRDKERETKKKEILFAANIYWKSAIAIVSLPPSTLCEKQDKTESQSLVLYLV